MLSGLSKVTGGLSDARGGVLLKFGVCCLLISLGKVSCE